MTPRDLALLSHLHDTTFNGMALNSYPQYMSHGMTFQWGKLVIVDTRVEAAVQRDNNGPIGHGGGGGATRTRSSQGGLGRGGGEEREGRSQTWGVGQPSVISEYRVLINCIFDLEWTHEDRRIALACGDGKCRVQDTETQAEVR